MAANVPTALACSPVKITWQKVAAGVYQTDTGRWVLRKYPGGLVWHIYDIESPATSDYRRTLKDAKLAVDKQIEFEMGSSNV